MSLLSRYARRRPRPTQLLVALGVAAAWLGPAAAASQAVAVDSTCALPRYSASLIGTQPELPRDLPAKGTYDMLVLPIDYSDAPGDPAYLASQANGYLGAGPLISA